MERLDGAATGTVTVATRIPNNSIVKIVHFLRHAEAEHNAAILTNPNAYKDIALEDSVLTAEGVTQCIQLRDSIEKFVNLNCIELLVVSPMRRTLQVSFVLLLSY